MIRANQPHIENLIGRPIHELDSPALLLDLAASDRNIAQLAQFFGDKHAQLRPHFKNHKCSTLARRQLDAGSAVGITCAKLGEAEILADNGFNDILIANQIVGDIKLRRLSDVAQKTNVTVAIDHLEQARTLSQMASATNITVGVLVEVDIGMNRCGIEPGNAALELTQKIQPLPGIYFNGLQAYEGHLVNLEDATERQVQSHQDMQLAIDTRRMIEAAGIPVNTLSGCSTATYDMTGIMAGVDEVQAGTYATMDCTYHKLRPELEMALTIICTVISCHGGNAVLDVGVKGASGEFGSPIIANHPDAQIPNFCSEEHCVVQHIGGLHVGDKVQMIPSHACTTCNLYHQLHVHQDQHIVDIWPIEASGLLT